MTPLLLGLAAVVLAGPAPALLARWHRSRRTPRAAMVLWQATALAAVLAAVGAGLALVTHQAWRHAPALVPLLVAGLALTLTVLVVARLLLSAHRVGTDLRELRRRHRETVDLVARRADAQVDRAAGVSIVEHDLPVAYCVPGRHGSRVVVSRGALARLTPDELAAVLAHERAHLRARHDLVLEAFAALHRAFPRWVSSAAALEEVRLLVEVLADRAAAQAVGPRALGSALVALGVRPATTAPGVALGADAGPHLIERVRLLADPGPHRMQSLSLLALAAGLLVAPTGLVVLPWLAEVVRGAG